MRKISEIDSVYSEIAIVENILIKLQWAFDTKFRELNDE